MEQITIDETTGYLGKEQKAGTDYYLGRADATRYHTIRMTVTIPKKIKSFNFTVSWTSGAVVSSGSYSIGIFPTSYTSIVGDAPDTSKALGYIGFTVSESAPHAKAGAFSVTIPAGTYYVWLWTTTIQYRVLQGSFSVTLSGELSAGVDLYADGSWGLHEVYICDGSEWALYDPYFYDEDWEEAGE